MVSIIRPNACHAEDPLPTFSIESGVGSIVIHPECRQVHLYPRMSVLLSDHIVVAVFVPLGGEKPCDESRRDSDRPKHHHHSGGVVFAIPGLAGEEKLFKRLVLLCQRHIKTITKVVRQERLDGVGFFIGRALRERDVLGQGGDPLGIEQGSARNVW